MFMVMREYVSSVAVDHWCILIVFRDSEEPGLYQYSIEGVGHCYFESKQEEKI